MALGGERLLVRGGTQRRAAAGGRDGCGSGSGGCGRWDAAGGWPRWERRRIWRRQRDAAGGYGCDGEPAAMAGGRGGHGDVTLDFIQKIECISYVRQNQVYTHMIDVE